ncbi:LuxR family transcriptional regulator [Terracoccus sp. 273MFTsu3.1]|uniref:helix-turn-helix transcriptional regulator n=1 Tax=Terracoccus sp. 273MFTsu3.1 TaxID=1172188 RepID=UPI0021018EF8|nr:LuxR family transcriptional regulator [Terracoccus sp. 273MFTsu3.1]
MLGAFEGDAPVGRREELGMSEELLRATLNEPVSGGQSVGVLVVGGDAGIGKTTFMQAMASRAGAYGMGFTMGHCLDIALGLPFGPVLEALRAYVRHLPERAALPPPAAWLATPGTHAEGASLQRLLAATEALADAGPLMLVLEDVHWADQSVRDWALAMVRTCRGRVLLGLTVRTEEVHRDHPLSPVLLELGNSPRALRLELHGLDDDSVAELARRRTGRDLQRVTVEALARRSEGNPLYVTELLDAEEGIPATLNALLLRRTDRLPDDAKHLCRLASVAGDIVDVELLEDASELEPDRFASALREVIDGNIFVRRADMFSFRHALLREAIHDDLLPRARVDLHASFARALRVRLEGGSSTERWEYGAALAHHAYAAHELDLAFEASVSAGLAGTQYGAAAAADYFERALELWDRVPEAARRCFLAKTDLPVLAAGALANEGVRDRVHGLLRRAVELLPTDGDPLAASRVYTAVGQEWADVPGVLDRAEALDRAIAFAGTAPSRELAEALIAGSFHTFLCSKFGAALSLAERAHEVAREAGATDLIPEATWERSGAMWCLGRCDEAIEANEIALRAAQHADQTGTALEIAGELSYNLLCRGRIAEGLQLARRTRTEAQQAGLPRLVAFAAEQEVEWLIQNGQFTEASDLYESACLPGIPAYRRTWIPVMVLLARGDSAAALTLERRWLESHESPTKPNLAHTPRLIQAYEQAGDIRQLLSVTESLLGEVSATDSPIELAQAARLGFTAQARAADAGHDASAYLLRLSETAFAYAHDHLTPQWADTCYHADLAIAAAHRARLAGRPAIGEWHQALYLAEQFGRHTALGPHLELARALLTGGHRDDGKEQLVRLWHTAHAIGAGWLEQQAALSARKHRVPLPLARSDAGPLDRLTPREQEVLEVLATGATDRAIAAALFITEKTASAHVGRILTKLGVTNRGQAAAIARTTHAKATTDSPG